MKKVIEIKVIAEVPVEETDERISEWIAHCLHVESDIRCSDPLYYHDLEVDGFDWRWCDGQ